MLIETPGRSLSPGSHQPACTRYRHISSLRTCGRNSRELTSQPRDETVESSPPSLETKVGRLTTARAQARLARCAQVESLLRVASSEKVPAALGLAHMAGSHLDRLEFELGAAIHPESRADLGSWHQLLASDRFRQWQSVASDRFRQWQSVASDRFRQWQSVAARRRTHPGFVKDDL